jgi:hypothetical protein
MREISKLCARTPTPDLSPLEGPLRNSLIVILC